MDVKNTIDRLVDAANRLLGVSATQKLFFVQHLSVMLRAGIPLSKALKTLAVQTNGQRLKEILEDIAAKVDKGSPFSLGLKSYPKVFDELFVNMVQSGEQTGNLEQNLLRLYVQIKKDHDLKSKIKGAMTYPIVVLIAMAGVGIGMMTFVVPKITGIFKDMNLDLPITTQFLILVSDILAEHGLLAAIIAIAFVYLFFKFIKSSKGQPVWHFIILRMPIFSGAVKKVNLARFARTLSSLLKTNVPISKTLTSTGLVLGNHWYRQALTEAGTKIEKGVLLSEVIAKYNNLFPPMIIQMIQVGEQTGAIDSIMEEIAGFYEEEVTNLLNNLSTLIEPILILVLGGGVAFVAVSIMMPLYSITQQI